MNIILKPLIQEHLSAFKQEMQEAFQQGYESVYGADKEQVLPEKDIDLSLQAKGAIAYEAIIEDNRVGGAVVNIDRDNHNNHLDFLYVRSGYQNHGIGKGIWKALEALYPETYTWETATPYFDQRNIHFYVNQCGFHIVEFFNQHHPGNDSNEYFSLNEGMFRFEKSLNTK